MMSLTKGYLLLEMTIMALMYHRTLSLLSVEWARLLLLWLLFRSVHTVRHHPLIYDEEQDRQFIANLTEELSDLWQCFEVHRQYQVIIYSPVPTDELEIVAASVHEAGASIILLGEILHLPRVIFNTGTRGTDLHITLTPAEVWEQHYASMWQRWTNLPLLNALGRHVVLLSSRLRVSNKAFQRMVRSFLTEMGSPRLAVVPLYARAGALHYRRKSNGNLIMAVRSLPDFCDAAAPDNLFQAALLRRPIVVSPIHFSNYVLHGQWEDRHGVARNDTPYARIKGVLQAQGLFTKKYEDRKASNSSQRAASKGVLLPTTYSIMLWYNPLLTYSPPVAQDDVCLVVRKGAVLPFPLVLLLPFDAGTWLAVGAALLALTAAWGTVLAGHSAPRSTAVLALAYSLEAALTGSISGRMSRPSRRILALTGIFMYVVVGSAYQGLLLGFLTTPKYFSDIDTLSEAAQAVDKVHTALHPSTFSTSAENSSGVQAMASKIELVETHKEELRVLQEIADTGRKAITMTVSSFNYLSKMRRFTVSGRPRLHRVRDPFFSPGMHVFAFRQANLVSKYVNDVLQRIVQAGLYDHWCEERQHLILLDSSVANNKLEGDREVEVNKPLTLGQFSGTFLLLFAGLIGASACFLIEKLYQNWSISSDIYFE